MEKGNVIDAQSELILGLVVAKTYFPGLFFANDCNRECSGVLYLFTLYNGPLLAKSELDPSDLGLVRRSHDVPSVVIDDVELSLPYFR